MKNIQVKKTASRGIAIAPVYCYQEPDLVPDSRGICEEQIPLEETRFEEARNQVISTLQELAEKNEIFAAHQEIAGDFMLQEGVLGKIRAEKKNSQMALQETIEEIAAIFSGMDDAYMKERATDVKDVGKRLMAALKGTILPDLGQMEKESIVAARDLYPSDTVKMNPDLVKGIITEEGGVTSHVSIMARSMNIPTLVGVKGILAELTEGICVCMDAEKGSIVINPDEQTRAYYEDQKTQYEKVRETLMKMRNRPAITRAGKRISLCANVGKLEDIRQALEMNIDGVGLFRSEFLYMENTHFPTEEEQFEVYKEAAALCPQELTIRTLDIGGDKELPYFTFEHEENPFLGWRAIRISLEMKDMFKEQLRAILRASAFGNVRIMFPMIISPEELREAKAVTEECKEELRNAGQDFDENIQIGMMMETPASVILAEEFAKEVDFFSIGTNDLTQYLLAVDRGNKKVSDRYDFMHPAVLKAIEQIIRAGHNHQIKVGMCGEMAGNVEAAKVLLKMGLDEFSMSAGNVDYIRQVIVEFE